MLSDGLCYKKPMTRFIVVSWSRKTIVAYILRGSKYKSKHKHRQPHWKHQTE